MELTFWAISDEPTVVLLQVIKLPVAPFGFSTRSITVKVTGYTPIRPTLKMAMRTRIGRRCGVQIDGAMGLVDHPGQEQIDGLDRDEREDRAPQAIDGHVPNEGPLGELGAESDAPEREGDERRDHRGVEDHRGEDRGDRAVQGEDVQLLGGRARR